MTAAQADTLTDLLVAAPDNPFYTVEHQAQWRRQLAQDLRYANNEGALEPLEPLEPLEAFAAPVMLEARPAGSQEG